MYLSKMFKTGLVACYSMLHYIMWFLSVCLLYMISTGQKQPQNLLVKETNCSQKQLTELAGRRKNLYEFLSVLSLTSSADMWNMIW